MPIPLIKGKQVSTGRNSLVESEEELIFDKIPRYSDHTAAFLLTPPPNVEKFILPRYWKGLDAPDELIDAVVHKAKQSHSISDRPSLAQLTRFEPYVSLAPQDRIDLCWARPFLALPRIRSFRCPSCIVTDENNKSIVPRDPTYGFGETLESDSFVACCVDEVGITDCLENTNALKHSVTHTRQSMMLALSAGISASSGN